MILPRRRRGVAPWCRVAVLLLLLLPLHPSSPPLLAAGSVPLPLPLPLLRLPLHLVRHRERVT